MVNYTAGSTKVLFLLLLLQLRFEMITPARKLGLFNQPAASRSWSPPQAEIDFVWFNINRCKNIEQDAFRPTHQGPSQGIGHKGPPGAP
ncbi:PREDICTED: uncharacterized protein LOC109116613 [Tarenaya hassleriana]|uniref:uncharacterized protein LOC109116613 n=1 Tax=Tarenaya hassleriana TaxID=28532 RepID=UPI0008FD747A|nr:PREDICTED: uncharacterized protein LOC109116613 [Tarenaya hassleriana]